MIRRVVLRLGFAALLAAIPAVALLGTSSAPGASAQSSAPPEQPMVVYGTAAGAEVGQVVHAFIEHDGATNWCGSGLVTEPSEPGYVVQVLDDSQLEGCGAPGREVRLLFTAAGHGDSFTGEGSSFAVGSFTYQTDSSVAYEFDVTLDQLEVRGVTPGIAAHWSR